jgi:hypothetical protein
MLSTLNYMRLLGFTFAKDRPSLQYNNLGGESNSVSLSSPDSMGGHTRMNGRMNYIRGKSGPLHSCPARAHGGCTCDIRVTFLPRYVLQFIQIAALSYVLHECEPIAGISESQKSCGGFVTLVPI